MTTESQVTGMSGPKSRQRRFWPWIAGAAAILLVLCSVGACVMAGFAVFSLGGNRSARTWGDAVAVIYLEGEIGVTSTTGTGVYGQEIVDWIQDAEANPSVKAIVLYINSPGGAVVPSAEMYRAVREAKKPVVAVMGDVAASGGYYVAAGADKILAHPATITGSIGVYGQLINAADLLKKLGVEGIIVRSGDSKAMGNWFEHPSPEQLAIEQAIVNELHEMFIKDVAAGRNMAEDKVRALADGRPYTGRQALEAGLIDALGNLQDAIDEAAKLGNIKGEPQIIEYYRNPSLLELWTSSQQSNQTDLLLQQRLQFTLPQMLYLGQ